MDPNWFPPADRPLQPGGRSVMPLAANGIGMLTLLLPQGHFRNAIAIPVLLWIPYNLRRYTTGKPVEDYLSAVQVSVALIRYLDFCTFKIPEQSLRRVGADGSTETPQEIQNMTLWQKLRWNFDLFTTLRGIGWNWRVKNVDDVPKDISRSRFAIEQVIRAAYCFAFIDIHEWYIRRTPFGDGSPPPDLFSLPPSQQVFLAWFRAFHSGFTLVLGYYILAAILVGSGISRPQSWPPVFGSFIMKGYTMRNIWGYCWHQFLRRIFETANSALTTVLGVKKSTVVSRYLQLYNGFLVSALIHHIGSLNTPYTPLIGHQFLFFMMQPVAITVEDLAIYLGRKAGLKANWKTKAIGYAWVGCVLSFTLRYAINTLLGPGLGSSRHPLAAKFSVMDRVFG